MSPKPTSETQENASTEDVDIKQATEAADVKSEGRPPWVGKFLAIRYDGYLKRTQEIICLAVAWPMMLVHVYMLYQYFNISNLFSMSVAAVLGIAVSDFVSGTLHWAGDTWGSLNTPFFGRMIIRMLRVHHYDLMEFTHHDFLTINADNFGLMIPFLIPSCRTYLYSSPDEIAASYNWICFFFFLSIFGALSTQFHKWAHMHTGLPPLVELLQRLHIILPRHLHLLHHKHPKRHASYFCITSGWMNYPLEYINYWEKLESVVERITGVKPRNVDFY